MSELPKWQSSPTMTEWNDTETSGPHKIVDEDGVSHTLSHLPYEWWCDSDGHVVQLVIATTRNVREAMNVHAYGVEVHRRAIKRGWFRWEDGYGLKNEQANPQTWAKRREEIRDKRVAKKNAETNAFNKGFRSEQEKLLEMLKAGQSANAEQMNAALERIAEAMAGKKGKKGSTEPDAT